MKMMLVVSWFLLLMIPAIEGSLRLEKPEGFSVEEKVMEKILETCYGDNDFKDLIFILGDFNEVFYKASVIRMSNLLNVDEEYESRQLLSIGVTKVVIIEDSPKRLHSELMSFKKTKWWNNMLPFFIISKNDEKCENSNEILNTTWRMEILNSIYICSESENTTLYTLNPITNYAPDPWKRMEDLNDSNIYRQIFDPHTSCNNLNYDKTIFLDDYQIQSVLSVPPYDEINEWSVPNDIPLSYFIGVLEKNFNASIRFIVTYRGKSSPHPRELKADIIFYELTPLETIRGSPLYSVRDPPCVALVKFNKRTILYKISHLWSSRVLYISAISLIIFYFILRMKNDEVTSALLDIIRFLTCVSIRTDTRGNSFRIYFTTMLIFIVIINGIFQGEIAAFLTKSEEAPPIKTMKELNDSGYHFYIFFTCTRVLLEWHLSVSNVEVMDNVSRIDYILNDTNRLNTCIIPIRVYKILYPSEPWSHIRTPVEILYPYSWTSRRDWPLHERFNCMLMRILESGIHSSKDDKLTSMMNARDKANDHELALTEIQPSYRPIKLANFKLAFKFLAIGLTFAMLILIVELKMREI